MTYNSFLFNCCRTAEITHLNWNCVEFSEFDTFTNTTIYTYAHARTHTYTHSIVVTFSQSHQILTFHSVQTHLIQSFFSLHVIVVGTFKTNIERKIVQLHRKEKLTRTIAQIETEKKGKKNAKKKNDLEKEGK